jgi:hypothetical protein
MKPKRRYLRHLILWGGIIAVVGFVVWRTIATWTTSWPQTDSEIVGSRVVRADVPIGSYRSVVILYRGEYHLRYSVNSKDYFLWTKSMWMDQDPRFVAEKMKSYEGQQSRYLIRYNPRNPAEAVAQRAP